VHFLFEVICKDMVRALISRPSERGRWQGLCRHAITGAEFNSIDVVDGNCRTCQCAAFRRI
jgi:hypothetical protein